MSKELETPTLPDLKIIQDGKQVDTSAIDNFDEFMSFVTLVGIAANTRKVRKYYEDRTSIGEVQNFVLEVTPEPQVAYCVSPSQSLHVRNDGPGTVFITINALGRAPAPLHTRDELTLDFETHKLEKFFVWSAPGTIATVRAMAKY
jgi:hypothetical protein